MGRGVLLCIRLKLIGMSALGISAMLALSFKSSVGKYSLNRFGFPRSPSHRQEVEPMQFLTYVLPVSLELHKSQVNAIGSKEEDSVDNYHADTIV